jgi:hypothetical protein
MMGGDARQMINEVGQIPGTSIDVTFRAGNGSAEALCCHADHPGAATIIATYRQSYLQLPFKAQVEVTSDS